MKVSVRNFGHIVEYLNIPFFIRLFLIETHTTCHICSACGNPDIRDEHKYCYNCGGEIGEIK